MSPGFPADYPILLDCYFRPLAVKVPEALRAFPHTGSSTQWVPTAFPIKAPTRQMLYPLSYRGTLNWPSHVSTSKTYVNASESRPLAAGYVDIKRDRPQGATSL